MTGRVLAEVLALTTLLACGCGDRVRNAAAVDGEAQRKAAEKAARAQRFEELLSSGKRALEAKRFEEAVKDLEEAVRLQDEAQARELLAQAQKAREESRKAAYDQAMLRGGQARKDGNVPAAVAAFRDALGQIPGDKEAATALREAEFHDFLEKGRAALKNEQFADAVKALGEAVKRQPEDKDS